MEGGPQLIAEHGDQRAKVVAFCCYPAGLGCSGLVANIALILGSWGYRVLAVDQNFADPSLYRYLSALLPETTSDLATAPVPLNCHFADPRGGVALIGPTTPTAVHSEGLAARRADLADAGYDFVLIDMPADSGSAPLASELADVIVLGYSLNRRVMTKVTAAAQAAHDSRRGDPLRILPVPMKVDKNAGGATERMLVAGRLQFSWLLDGWSETGRQRYLAEVEIPYEPEYTVDEGLAFLDDSSGQRDRLVSAYARLAAEIAPGQRPASRSAITDETRARYRHARLTAVGDRATVTILHAPADRYWAEWLVSELERLNLSASQLRIDHREPGAARPSSELLVVSHDLLVLPDRDRYLAALSSPPTDGQVRLAVSVDGATLPAEQFPAHGFISLAGLNEGRAHAELASYYRVAGAPATGYHRLRFPGARDKDGSSLSNLPPRDGTCYGRDDAIDQIRDYLTGRDAPPPLTLSGPPGIGKSKLALEYASRFAEYYDLVFRIQADSPHAVREGLGTLAARLPDLHPAGDAGLSALRYLSTHPSMPERWLLIYDGADTPTVLDGLLPEPGRGHVLVTARTTAAGSPADLPVTPLTPDAASAMLAALVPGLLPAEASQVAEALDYVPLAIRLAAGWLNVVVQQLLANGMRPATVVSNAVQEFIDQLTTWSGRHAMPDADPARLAVELLLQRLRMERYGAAALLLLETCAFLAPTGMSVPLLQSPAMLAQFTEADAEFSDPVLVNNVRSTLSGYGLSVPERSSRDPVRLHPWVREILRDRMAPAERTARTGAVTRILSSHAPLAIEDDVAGHEVYAELLQHVEPSSAPLQLDFGVRRWLVNQVRYLWQLGTVNAWHAAADLGERLARHWAAALDDHDDPLLLRLRTQLANVYRSLSRFEEAQAMDLDVLRRQRRVLGLAHLRTLMTARSYGADLRVIGEFEAALNEDQSTWQAFRSTLGDGHLMTIRASDNLALSELLCGYPELALQRQREDADRAGRLRSEQPWQRPWVMFHVGTLERELGWYEDSRRTLDEAKYDFDNLVAEGRLAPTLWVVLRTAAGLAITERRLGKPAPEATQAVLNAFLETHGDAHPDVLGLEMSLAGDLHATGHSAEAASRADDVRRRCAAVFGDGHPFTGLCQVNLSSYELAAGQSQLADDMSGLALSALEARLNAGHPWVQAARVARANVRAVTGHPAEAAVLEELVLAEYQRRLGPGNPLLRTVAINHANTRMLLNQPGALPASEEGMRRRGAIEIDFPPY